MKNSILIILAFTVLQSCHQGSSPADQAKGEGAVSIEHLLRSDSAKLAELRNEHMVMATLYQQTAGEYRALCFQAYNLGRLMLDKDLADKSIDKHRVVVLDIDETVLDNSPFQAKCILAGTSYPDYWEEWCNMASAAAVPGALDFLRYAVSGGVEVFYVTNRKIHLKEATLKNLTALGFPYADDKHLMMRTTDNSKEPRRQELMKKYHISLLFGDNLNDFTNTFENLDVADRDAETDREWKQFGSRFIVLPNAMYGDWETALYPKDRQMSDSLRFLARRQALRAF